MASTRKTGDREFLKNFRAAEVKLLLSHAQPRSFRSGDVLLVEGEEGNSMLMIDVGKVRVMKGTKLLATLQAGSSVGEMALLDPAPRSASVVAASHGEAYELSHSSFQRMLDDHDPVAIKTLRILCATVCARLSNVNRMVERAVSDTSAGPAQVFGRLWKRITGQDED